MIARCQLLQSGLIIKVTLASCVGGGRRAAPPSLYAFPHQTAHSVEARDIPAPARLARPLSFAVAWTLTTASCWAACDESCDASFRWRPSVRRRDWHTVLDALRGLTHVWCFAAAGMAPTQYEAPGPLMRDCRQLRPRTCIASTEFLVQPTTWRRACSNQEKCCPLEVSSVQSFPECTCASMLACGCLRVSLAHTSHHNGWPDNGPHGTQQ